MTKERTGRTVTICLLITAMVVMCFLVISTNSNKVSASERVRINLMGIQNAIMDEVKNNALLAYSSNPYDYINNNKYYDEIIAMGVSALPELEATLQSSESNGLNEYIIAIAIEQITQADLNKILGNVDYGWATAKEFESSWVEVKKDVAKSIMSIINSLEMTVNDKITKINNYGLLAIPTLNEYVSSSNSYERSNDNLIAELKILVSSYNVQSDDISTINEYLSH